MCTQKSEKESIINKRSSLCHVHMTTGLMLFVAVTVPVVTITGHMPRAWSYKKPVESSTLWSFIGAVLVMEWQSSCFTDDSRPIDVQIIECTPCDMWNSADFMPSVCMCFYSVLTLFIPLSYATFYLSQLQN
ncbi:hypothetical protein BsWGS_07084 [Bradybaena similaris]